MNFCGAYKVTNIHHKLIPKDRIYKIFCFMYFCFDLAFWHRSKGLRSALYVGDVKD